MTQSHVFRLPNDAVLVVDLDVPLAEWRLRDDVVTPRQLLRGAGPDLRRDVGRAARRAVAEIRAQATRAEEPGRAETLRVLAARLWETHRVALGEPLRPDEQQALPGF